MKNHGIVSVKLYGLAWESARSTISQQLATIPESLGLARVTTFRRLSERPPEVTLSPRSTLPASPNHALPSAEIATFLRVKRDKARRVRCRGEKITAMISQRDTWPCGEVRHYRMLECCGVVVHGITNTFPCSIARAARERNTCLEIRKREIALRGTRDYTQEGLDLCRYRHVVRPGRGQPRSSY